ncbi:unnamed protein product [Clonostachys rosea]|uniref:Zn(2)-C6 fungal-type domain-containing protein n=1 Tax=Bionectria ochroleuca TaxID=29856 RepID=A0ABY6UB77_BIOOC|nr:unnamed protein product [Clonostachys rosea]
MPNTASPTNTARAKASCSRCHRRKKRCDRELPACKNCRTARVKCSLLDDNSQTATYSVAYVRGLERRLQELRSNLVPEPQMSPPVEDSLITSGNDQSYSDSAVADLMGPSPVCEEGQLPADLLGPPPKDIPVEPRLQDSETHIEPLIQEPSPTFDQELKSVSFSVAAERHLGSTSGLSFAKLTQMVLRRLTPDRADFVFDNPRRSFNSDQLFDFDSSLDFFNSSVFETLSESIPSHPTLFGDILLEDTIEPTDAVSGLNLPTNEAYANRLVDFYFAHSHTLYPMLIKSDFMRTLQQVRDNPFDPAAQCPLALFRVWMVFAIGSTAYSSVTLMEESESRIYYSKALEYFERAMALGEMAALEVIMLQISYSFFNQLGPNTWFLVGMAARLAVGIGLHIESTYASWPVDVQQHRKRIFFSIYMMDRVVSLALGRPFALHDDDIDVSPFADANEDDIHPDGIRSQSSLTPSIIAVPLHILALRTIAGKIAKQVYSNRRALSLTVEEREEILHSLHKELIDWRRNMPFPLPDISDRVPHFGTNWYDFNYYTHIAMLYRPSPLFPVVDERKIKILEEAASMSLRQAFNMHQQQRLAYNWLNLLALFTSTLSLIYAITVQPNDLATALKETRAIDDLDLSIELFDTLGIKFLAAKKIRGMIAEVSRRYKDLRTSL